MIGSGALVGLVGLYFAWNFYSKRSTENVKLLISEKETPEKESEQ